MNLSVQLQLVKLILLGIAGVITSWIFGADGLEAFFAIYVLSGIMLTLYFWQFIQIIFKQRAWLIFKLLGSAIVVFTWLVILVALFMPFDRSTYNPSIDVPYINWYTFAAILASYIVTRAVRVQKEETLDGLTIKALSTIFTIVVMLFASFGFFGIESKYRGLALVIATELQFIMNYVFVNTNYLKFTHKSLTHSRIFNNLLNDSYRNFILFFALGLPVLVPMFILMFVIKSR